MSGRRRVGSEPTRPVADGDVAADLSEPGIERFEVEQALHSAEGATLQAIAQKLPELPANARVLGFNYDTGERYLSVDGFLPA